MELCGLNKKILTATQSELIITREKTFLSPYLEKHIPITHVVGVHVHQQGNFSHGFIQIHTIEQKYFNGSTLYQYSKNAPQATSDENAILIDVKDVDGYHTALQIKAFVESELLRNSVECEDVQKQMQEQQQIRADKEQKEQEILRQEQLFKMQQEQLRLQQEQMNAMARCPRCGSTSLSAHKKGFGIGKAVVGAAMLGGIGLVAGNVGAKKVRVTCLKCGKQFMA